MGKREFRQVLTVVRRLWGQALTGPSGVRDQSIARIAAPISPPPASVASRSARGAPSTIMPAPYPIASANSSADCSPVDQRAIRGMAPVNGSTGSPKGARVRTVADVDTTCRILVVDDDEDIREGLRD